MRAMTAPTLKYAAAICAVYALTFGLIYLTRGH